MYNMNKYFIESLKKQWYVCFDGSHSYLNLIIRHWGDKSLYKELVYDSSKIDKSIKKILKLCCMIIDKVIMRP